MARFSELRASQAQQLTEQLQNIEDKLESISTYDLLRVPQYLKCETDPEDPHKKTIIEFPRGDNALFIIDFVKGNNLIKNDKTTLELQFYDEEDNNILKTFAFDPIPHLPNRLYPGAHAVFQCWVYEELSPDEVSDDDYEARTVECVGMTSLGIPAEIEIMSKKIDDLLQKVENLSKRLEDIEDKIDTIE